jgi:hypothetical protein
MNTLHAPNKWSIPFKQQTKRKNKTKQKFSKYYLKNWIMRFGFTDRKKARSTYFDHYPVWFLEVHWSTFGMKISMLFMATGGRQESCPLPPDAHGLSILEFIRYFKHESKPWFFSLFVDLVTACLLDIHLYWAVKMLIFLATWADITN